MYIYVVLEVPKYILCIANILGRKYNDGFNIYVLCFVQKVLYEFQMPSQPPPHVLCHKMFWAIHYWIGIPIPTQFFIHLFSIQKVFRSLVWVFPLLILYWSSFFRKKKKKKMLLNLQVHLCQTEDTVKYQMRSFIRIS